MDNMRTTDKKRIARAFAALRRQGYFARMNLRCCQTCALTEIPEDKAKRYVYYHAQDAKSLNEDGCLTDSLFIGWAGDAYEIIKVLQQVGLRVEHNADPARRIEVLPS